MLAARAAHELRAYERRDAYLAAGGCRARTDELVRIVTAAELLLDERRYQEALDLLKRLPRRHTAALRLELKAQQQARNWEQVLALTEDLRKRNVFDATAGAAGAPLRAAENLKRKALDARALEEAWDKDPVIRPRGPARRGGGGPQCFIALGGCGRAHRIIEQAAGRGLGQRSGGALRRMRRRRYRQAHRACRDLARSSIPETRCCC